jgi:hypothetical protein
MKQVGMLVWLSHHTPARRCWLNQLVSQLAVDDNIKRVSMKV